MMNYHSIHFLFGTLFLLFLSVGCSPTVKGDKNYIPPGNMPFVLVIKQNSLSRSDNDTLQSRISMIEDAVHKKLINRGYLLLDQKIVRSRCKGCDPLQTFSNIAGYIELELRKVSTNRFGLGFLNIAKGSLTVFDKNNNEKIRSDYTEYERGGILFDSGQVITSIEEQIEVESESGFSSLASEFAEDIVMSLPEADSAIIDRDLIISSVDISGEEIITFCITGTPSMKASVLLGGSRMTLREVSTGTYCSRFQPLDEWNQYEVVLKSSYGAEVRKSGLFPSYTHCRNEDLIPPKEVKRLEPIKLPCEIVEATQTPRHKGNKILKCTTGSKECFVRNIYLYEQMSPLNLPAFKSPQSISTPLVTLRSIKSPFVAFVAEYPDRTFSVPYVLKVSDK